MSVVLVVNSGSSSIKYQLIDVEAGKTLASGLIERIGEHRAELAHRGAGEKITHQAVIADHHEGFAAMLAAFEAHGPALTAFPPRAVGHRVVHGGAGFDGPTIVTDAVKTDIAELGELAPLHNPANLAGIEAAQRAFPDVPHVVVFDTAFHRTLPERAYRYAIDREMADRGRIRRYGFHGTSHKFVSERAAAFLDRPLGALNQIVLHLGNGASACAIRGGISVDTSMGFTPLEGLVMGTRSGDIDPAAVLRLARTMDLGPDELDTLLNRRSGLLGLTGTGDMRDVLTAAERGDIQAAAAIEIYVHRVRRYLGAYLVELGQTDVIVFTAGVGENNAHLRQEILARLDGFGIILDPERNAAPAGGIRRISTDDSATTVLVVPTDEELEIARQTLDATGDRPASV